MQHNIVVAIAAGWTHSMALTSEGRVVDWGYYWNGSEAVPMNVPGSLSNVVAIAAGCTHSLALTDDGRVVAWGDTSGGGTEVPNGLSNVVAIAAGYCSSLALTAEGSVVAWGDTSGEETEELPRGLSNVVVCVI